ncbi:hypothetical protein KKD19_03965 [Patescibacteria group bacterium]|nr:hypothetical protein [Patescibacteria group bacterium]MBU4512363.1 hypothetical protein [Patescibacteria group bacterium]MCG2692789.1 hypothetical protein [Candidatus Parcubacteria bacterium]
MALPASFKTKTAPVSMLESLPWKNSKGLVKFVDDKGLTCGFFIGAKSLEELDELLEDIEAASPEFQKEMEESIASGVVSGEEVKKRLGL